jgi:hypothetical protein
VAGVVTPVLFEWPGRPDLDARRSRCEHPRTTGGPGDLEASSAPSMAYNAALKKPGHEFLNGFSDESFPDRLCGS